MPWRLEKKLEATADKRGYTGERKRRYVWGTITKLKKRYHWRV